MKLKVEKTMSGILDTSKERKRIKECWPKNSETHVKLNNLLDLIEAQKWEEALKEIQGEWWRGRDEEQECSRLEFIGLLEMENSDFDPWTTYADLIYRIAIFPENYTLKLEGETGKE